MQEESGSNNINVISRESNLPENTQLIIETIDLLDFNLFKQLESELAYPKIIVSRNIPIILTKSFFIAFGSLAGYPYFNAARSFIDIEFLSWYLGISIIVSNAGLTIRSFLELVDDIRKNINDPSNKDNLPLKKKILKTSQWILTFSSGMLSALPSTYIAYKFNNDSIFWPGVLFITDSALNSYSLSRTSLNDFSCSNSDIKNTKAMCIRTLQAAIDYFISLKKNERYLLLQSKGMILDGKLVVEGKVSELIAELIQSNEIFQKSGKCSPNYGAQNKIMKFFGRILSFSWIIVGFNLVYDGSKILYDHPVFNISIALLTVTPASLLEINYSGRVYERLSQYTASIIRRSPLKSASTIFFPNLNPLLNIAAFLITAFSFGARCRVASDYFSGTLGYILIIMIILTTVAYKSYSLPQLIDELLIWISSFYINSLESDTLKLTTKLTEMPALLNNLSDNKFNFFYNKNKTIFEPSLISKERIEPLGEERIESISAESIEPTARSKYSIKNCLPFLSLSQNSSTQYKKLKEDKEEDQSLIIVPPP